MAILKSLKANTKTVSFRLPAEVVADYEAAKAAAKAAGFALDLTDQVERLIAAAVRQARAELSDTSQASQSVVVANNL
jgi:hypothetical protein